MFHSELDQLQLLSEVDDLRRRTQEWVTTPTVWQPALRAQSLLQRVLSRVDALRVRMEAPLVVATFGGTGTGKSSLVNALIGEEVTTSGRQRPTTRQPVLIAHSQTPLQEMGLPLEDVEVIQRDADLLRDIILLDCPDPDTAEGASPGSHLERLRALLPYCDVLLYVSTQQKYRSSRVSTELKTAAAGCRMIFVQSHADLDEDIREDWKRTLAADYAVPEVFFVDSRKAFEEQQAGQRPTGEMGRLLNLLLNKLGASARVRVRRANVLDLIAAGLQRCQSLLGNREAGLNGLQQAMSSQQLQLAQRMSGRLQTELLASRRLWERRLLTAVTDRWGLSPFSVVLSTYNSLGNLLASTVMFRARSAAQLALLGAVQGARWIEGKRQELIAESSLRKVDRFGLDDTLLREAELVLTGHVEQAELPASLVRSPSLDRLRAHAAEVETRFVGDAGQGIDKIIADLSAESARIWLRPVSEILLCSYLGFILLRMGKNFFWDSLINNQAFLPSEFYLPAILFGLLLCGVLIMLFTARMRHGLEQRIRELTSQLIDSQLGQGLFPELEEALNQAGQCRLNLDQLAAQAEVLRKEVSGPAGLGNRKSDADAV